MDVTPLGTAYGAPVFPAGNCNSLVLALSKRTPSTEQYFAFPSDTTIAVREVQLENASLPMDVTLLGMTIDVTPSGIVIDAREVHPSNADRPMDVTPSRIVIDVREVHPENT